MSRKRAASPMPMEDLDEEFDDDDCSNSSRNQSQAPPIQRNAANARERARMRVLSSAFCRLKTKLPWVPADTKLSKLDTLRLATIYIQQLRSSLATGKELYQPPNELSQLGGNSNSSRNQTSLVWPFSFQQQQQHQHQIQQSSQPQPLALKEPIIEPDIIRSTSNANPWFNREAALNMNSHYDQNYSYNDSYSYGKYPIRNSTTNNTNSTTAHG